MTRSLSMTIGPIDQGFEAMSDILGVHFSVFSPTGKNVARIRSKTTLNAKTKSDRHAQKEILQTEITALTYEAPRCQTQHTYNEWDQHRT